MPLFEYYCSQCQQRFEQLVRQRQEEIPCPQCGTLSPKVFSTFCTTGGEKASLSGGSGCSTCSSSSCSTC